MEDSEKQAQLSPGSKVDRFQIIQLLGKGGMGEVYLALDTELQREVALKLIGQGHSSSRAARFLFGAEAQTLANFTHPNSVVIYDIGQYQGQPFIAMEYFQGKTLESILNRSPLSVEESIQVFLQLDSLLREAHAQGIVHGDISAQNVLVNEDGRVKLLDFGLAGLSSNDRTTEGIYSGNPSYSAPERVHGASIFPATDIFSFAVLMYYCLTGQLPFTGKYEAALAHAIVNDDPVAPHELNHNIPLPISMLVLRLLSKDPETRVEHYVQAFNTIGTLSSRGKRSKAAWNSVTAYVSFAVVVALIVALFTYWPELPEVRKDVAPDSIDKNVVAVIPFENIGNMDNSHFTEGIVYDITERLARSGNLKVISRMSANRYRDSNMSVSEIANELDCRFLVTGSVRWDSPSSQQRAKISAELIDAVDGSYLWNQSYEIVLGLESILETQNTIASEVATTLARTIGENLVARFDNTATSSLSAYDFYLRGNSFFYHSWDSKDQLNACTMYQKAVELDENFAAAYAMLARSHASIFWEYLDRSESRVRQAKGAIDKALQLNPDLPEAQLALGYYYYQCEQNYETALEQFQRAVEHFPSNAELYNAIAAVQRRYGMLDSAVVNFKRSYKLDPRSHQAAFDVGLTYGLLRDYESAEKYLDQSALLSPDFSLAHIYKAWLSIFRDGNVSRARSIIGAAKETTDLSSSRYYWWLSRIIATNYRAALNEARLSSDSAAYYLHNVQLARLIEDSTLALKYADSALSHALRQIARRPDDPRFVSELGLAYAAVGIRDSALQYSNVAVSLLPTSRDAFDALFLFLNLAEVLVMFDEYEKALDQLEFLLSIPGFISEPYLRLDPLWVPLRNQTRFAELLKKARVN